MNVLLIGAGGREHALAWKLSASPLMERLYCLPGNPGTALHGSNLAGDPTDPVQVLAAVQQHPVDLVVIGPEAPLAAGLGDILRQEGTLVFGPGQAAAQIESSKAFSKELMRRHAIPSASFETFSDYHAAQTYLKACDPARVVIKASGLAAGKGVFLPQNQAEAQEYLRSLMQNASLGEAGRQVVIEERLHGPELSVLAFCDGVNVVCMPAAQDHKRLLEGDQGPNTGGMGAFAPSPLATQPLIQYVEQSILQPAVDGLRAEGMPFIGVLYAGLLLSSDGPRVLEFNCRFGDPETQAILPLLESDLLEVLLACAQGRLAQAAGRLRWLPGAAAVIVLASQGYPGVYRTGFPIRGVENLPEQTWAFHAGTAMQAGTLMTAGGRVLGIAGYGESLQTALSRAYLGVKSVEYEGMVYRRDIGGGQWMVNPTSSVYSSSGVSIEAGNRAVALMRQAVRSTYTDPVLSDVGAFGGLFSAAGLQGMQDPVLVASTDGVGTKVMLAAQAENYASIGVDIVNHCINDILVQGAKPLFFLDYIAADRLQPEVAAQIVSGMSAACRDASCALLGGETAEMPGVYAQGKFDVAGTIVGVVEKGDLLPRANIQPGDLLVGLASSGAHTNGYSLLRRVFQGVPLETVYPELGCPLGEVLLAPHRSYLPVIGPLLPGTIKALVHLTGGAFIENIPRVLPPGMGARIQRASWPVPPLFVLVQQRGEVTDEEMHRVFNMGIGLLGIVSPKALEAFQSAIAETTWVVGEVTNTPGVEIQ